MRPLAPGWRASRTWTDGSSANTVISSFVKPNDRLTSFERLEIYNKQYWFRLIDCIGEDFPGLEAVLGAKRCNRLFRAYLAEHPSRSFTLRNLGDRLPEYLEQHPQWGGSRHPLAVEMARFEWAQVLAFDSAAHRPLGIDDLLGADPGTLRLALQPYLSVLELHWPLDEFSIALKRPQGRSEASNAADANNNPEAQTRRSRRPRLPRPEHVFVAVHRLNNAMYYKRLEPAAFAMLTALRDGQSLADACETAFAGESDIPDTAAEQNGTWFRTWAGLGWFCKAH